MAHLPASSRYSLVESDAEIHLASLAEEVESGLSGVPKTLPCRFLYDEVGSRIFEEICDVPEYYLTRCEREILEDRADEIAARCAPGTVLAELGSGSASKTRVLIEAFLRRHGGLAYVPVDISRTMLEESSLALLERYHQLEIRAIATEYKEGLRHLRDESRRPKLILWLGSNVGNFTRKEAGEFLSVVRRAMSPRDRLLVGIDLRKQREVLELAYDDSQGVTARFSLNLLRRINDELEADFALDAFSHRATWEEKEGRVKIDIVSQRKQRVAIEALDLEVAFSKDESIHIEDSYKYSLDEIDDLAAFCGLRLDTRWLDAASRFSLNLLRTA